MPNRQPRIMEEASSGDSSAPFGAKWREFRSALRNICRNLLRMYRKQKWRISHFWLFPVVFIYFELMLRLFTGTGFFRSILYPLIFGLAAGGFCTALTCAFKPKVNRIISMVLLYLFGLLFIVECLIRSSFQVYMTLGAITTGAGGVMGNFASDLLRAIVFGLPKIFLFFLPAILYTVTGRRRMPARRYSLPFVGILLALALVVQGIGVLAATHGGNSEKYKGQFDFDTATQVFGLLTSVRLNETYSLLGGGNTSSFVMETEASPSPSVSVAPTPTPEVVYGDNVMDIDFEALSESTTDEDLLELNEYVSSLTPSKQNEYTGLFAGKNLILICAEAFSDSVISQELTPTLYRMTHNGFYFSEYYQPTWGGSTSTGEYSFLLGLAPLDGVQSMYQTQYNNNYFTLGSQLQRLGYYSAAYHNGVYDYYDRDLTHENLGYDTYIGRGNGMEEMTDGVNADDIMMFEVTMDTYIDQQPFSIYYMTLSGHCIYSEDAKQVTSNLSRVQAVLGSRYQDTTLYYFCYQMVLEDALTYMIETLEAAGIADDTVICMTADHYPYGLEKSDTFGNSEDYVADLYGYTYEHPWEKDHNSLIIWSGCLENADKDMACEISSPTYSLDIVPTLSNLFGLEYDSRLLVGRDVFSDTEPIVLWNNYSWATEQGKYDSSEKTFYPNEGYTEDEDYISRIKTIVANKLSFSDKALEYDYYGYLFDEE